MNVAESPHEPNSAPAGYKPAGQCPDCGATLYRARYKRADCRAGFGYPELVEGLWHPPTWTSEAELMRQQLARAGPRPAHLRELFDWQLEARDGVGPRWAGLRERGRLAYFHGEAAAWWARLPTDAHCWRWLLGELADCADAMPDATCERLGLAPGSTYGHAVEALREEAASVPLDAPVALRHELPVDVAAHMCQLLAEGRWPGRLDVEVAKDAAGRLATSAQLEEAIRAEAGRQRPFRPGIPSDLGRLSVELAGLVDDAARFVVRL